MSGCFLLATLTHTHTVGSSFVASHVHRKKRRKEAQGRLAQNPWERDDCVHGPLKHKPDSVTIAPSPLTKKKFSQQKFTGHTCTIAHVSSAGIITVGRYFVYERIPLDAGVCLCCHEHRNTSVRGPGCVSPNDGALSVLCT